MPASKATPVDTPAADSSGGYTTVEEEDVCEDTGASPVLQPRRSARTSTAKKRKLTVTPPVKRNKAKGQGSTGKMQHSPKGSGPQGNASSGAKANTPKHTPFEAAILKEMREMKGIMTGMEGMEERLKEKICLLYTSPSPRDS